MPLSAKEYNHMQVIFDNISDMIFYIEIKENGTFCYKDANKSAIQQLHLPKDFIGKTIHDIMPQDLANTIIYNYQQAIINKDTISFVAPFTDQSRVERQYESKVTPLFHQNDNIDRIIFVTRDISEQQRQENELRRVKRELELTFEHVADALFTFDKNGDYIKIHHG